MATSPSVTPTQPAKKLVDFSSEADIDKDWKPNGRRPQSTIARSFSAELEDIFRIDDSVADLDAKLDERKHKVQTHASELEALEQRIREMEERLKRGGAAPAPQTTIPQRRPAGAADGAQQIQIPADQNQKHGGSRPGTAKASQQAVPGALPPTPTASEGEYEFVPDPYTTSFGPDYPRYRHQHLVPRMTTTNASSGGGTGDGTGTTIRQAQQLRSQHYQHQSTLSNNNQHMNIINKTPTQPPPDARSVKSVRTIDSESGSADFVIVPGPDGDGEQDHH